MQRNLLFLQSKYDIPSDIMFIIKNQISCMIIQEHWRKYFYQRYENFLKFDLWIQHKRGEKKPNLTNESNLSDYTEMSVFIQKAEMANKKK